LNGLAIAGRIFHDAVMEQPPSRNVELKARMLDLESGHRVAQGLCATRLPDQLQRDTYFHCPHGRLKLREIDGVRAELIWYGRADEEGPKTSRYFIVPVSEPLTLKTVLSAAYGVRGVVVKHRSIYLHKNVRIHLDSVDNLGTFLEFEAVLAEGDDEHHGRAVLNDLKSRFAIADSDLITCSYGDLSGPQDAGR
jgi:adenylate cyclase, class 2